MALEILKIIELELKYSVVVESAPGNGEDPFIWLPGTDLNRRPSD